MQFLNHLTLGQYVPADSPVHHLDPRCKIVATVLLLTGVFLVRNPAVFGIWAILLAGVTLVSKLTPGLVLRTARPVLILVLFTAVIHIFLTKGDPVWQWGILSITREGIAMAVKMGLRLIFLVMFAGFLTLTTSPMEFSDGLEKLFSPFARFGFPAHDLAMMMTIALRFIPTLLDETDRIMKAQLARGADLDRGGLIRRIRAFIPILVPLFVIVFQRAEDLANAMESRGYRGGHGRSRMTPLVWKASDSFVLIFAAGFVVALFLLDRNLLN